MNPLQEVTFALHSVTFAPKCWNSAPSLSYLLRLVVFNVAMTDLCHLHRYFSRKTHKICSSSRNAELAISVQEWQYSAVMRPYVAKWGEDVYFRKKAWKFVCRVFEYAESISNRIQAGKPRDPTQNQEIQDGRSAYSPFRYFIVTLVLFDIRNIWSWCRFVGFIFIFLIQSSPIIQLIWQPV